MIWHHDKCLEWTTGGSTGLGSESDIYDCLVCNARPVGSDKDTVHPGWLAIDLWFIFLLFISASYAFSDLTPLAGHQEEHPACKNWLMRCLCGCLSGARCRLFAYGPADATAIPKPHHLLPHLNPDWLYLSCTNLPRLSWKRGRLTGVIVVVVIYLFDQCGCYSGEWSTRPTGESQSTQVQLCHCLSVCKHISETTVVCVWSVWMLQRRAVY